MQAPSSPVNWKTPHFVEIVGACSTVVGNPEIGSIIKMPGAEARRLCVYANPPRAKIADDFVEQLGEAAPRSWLSAADVAEIRVDRDRWIRARTPPTPNAVPYLGDQRVDDAMGGPLPDDVQKGLEEAANMATETSVSNQPRPEGAEEETVERVLDVTDEATGLPEDVARALGIDPALPGEERTARPETHRMMESPTKRGGKR